MWIFNKVFKKAVDNIITREVNNRSNEVELLLSKAVDKLNQGYEEKKAEYNSKIVSLTDDIQIKIEELEQVRSNIEQEHRDKINTLTKGMELQISELERVRNKAESEEKRLWERLDILRDNLNTEEVWLKLWEMAYSKAVDAVWAINQKETLHLIELARQESYLKSKAEFDEDLRLRMDNLIQMSNSGENIPAVKILALKKDIEEKKLQAERIKNESLVNKYSAQLEIIGGLL